GAHAVARQHHRPARQAIRDDSPDEREGDAGERRHRENAAEGGRRAVDGENGERQRDRDERVADGGGDAAEPEQPELPLGERRERALEPHWAEARAYLPEVLSRFRRGNGNYQDRKSTR